MDLAHIPTLRAHISQFIWIFQLQTTYNTFFTLLLHYLGKNHFLGGVDPGRQKAAIMGCMLAQLFCHICLAPLLWGILIQISMGKSGSTPNPTLTALNPICPGGGGGGDIYTPLPNYKFGNKDQSTFWRVMQKLRSHTQASLIGSIHSFLGVSRWNHSHWTNRSEVICWNLISHWNWQSKNSCANRCVAIIQYWHLTK